MWTVSYCVIIVPYCDITELPIISSNCPVVILLCNYFYVKMLCCDISLSFYHSSILLCHQCSIIKSLCCNMASQYALTWHHSVLLLWVKVPYCVITVIYCVWLCHHSALFLLHSVIMWYTSAILCQQCPVVPYCHILVSLYDIFVPYMNTCIYCAVSALFFHHHALWCH